ncbi:unnamed protein product, partial [Musa acuminata subsp. burmannicoides]
MIIKRLVIILVIIGCLYTLSHGRDIERRQEENKIVIIPCAKAPCPDWDVCYCCAADR